jgi:hypothetical protein
MAKCQRCDGDGEAHGSDRPFEWSGPGTYPGPCPVCGGTGIAPLASTVAREIAARVWCDQEMGNVVMDVDAAEAIARIIDGVRRGQGVGDAPRQGPRRTPDFERSPGGG